MRVLYDHQIFTMQTHGGISRYFANLSAGIDEIDNSSSEVSILHSDNYYVKNKSFLPQSIGKRIFKKERRLTKWSRRYSEYVLGQGQYDVFHPTYYEPYYLNKIKKPYVLTVHDLIHEIHPEFFSFHDLTFKFKRQSIENASHLIAISESTKNDLQTVYGVNEKNISVIHHGHQIISFAEKTIELPFSKFVLFVGERIRYKNFKTFLYAMKRIQRFNSDIGIVCAGGGAFTSVDLELIKTLNIKNIFQATVGDSELRFLYRKASAFVYPSLTEGFGLPILEAFSNNCPTIVSDIEPFREVGSDVCEYFDPNNPEDMARAIESIVNSDQYAEQMKEKGKLRLKEFSMDKCIKKTEEVYKNVL